MIRIILIGKTTFHNCVSGVRNWEVAYFDDFMYQIWNYV